MAETWVLNKKIAKAGGSFSFNFNFKSNGQRFNGIDVQYVISTPPFYLLIQYNDPQTDDTVVVYNSSNTPAWTNEAYRTITFRTPTTNLIQWLQANATQQFLCGANDMFAVADAIRTKAGSTAALFFPDGFISAVNGIQTGGGGVGHKVTFPATATNWNRVYGDYSGLLMADGNSKPITDYSTLAGKTFEGVVGIRCKGSTGYDVLKMTLSSGTIAQTNVAVQMGAASFNITASPNTTPTFFSAGHYTFWWPLTDVVISAIEMYNTD